MSDYETFHDLPDPSSDGTAGRAQLAEDVGFLLALHWLGRSGPSSRLSTAGQPAEKRPTVEKPAGSK